MNRVFAFAALLLSMTLIGCSTDDLRAVNDGMSQSMESNRVLLEQIRRAQGR
jgi:hypothetical protein